MNPWIWMTFAIVLEVMGTINLKLSDGMSKLVPSLLLAGFYAGSFYSLSEALKHLDIGVAYAVWAGLGTALLATIGFFYFGEAVSTLKIVSILLIIAGVIGLHLCNGVH